MRSQTQPNQGKRVALYVRVSSDEQVQGYSLPAQERAAETFCRQQGWEIVAVYRDEGKSARTDDERKRPSFARMMADAEERRFDAVLVHKLDRFARNRRVAFDALHRLGKAGVGFLSLSENMDHTTPAGQLMLTMLVGMAQFYSDNLSFETKKGKGERKAQGLYNGLLPFGVVKNESGLPVLDREARYCDLATKKAIVPADGLDLAFELAAAGRTDREIAKTLTEAGYRTTGNRGMNPFTKDSVRVILRNRFYVGELPDGNGGWLPGRHGALIDPDKFDRATRSRESNLRKPRRAATAARSPWALSGVALCGSCGSPIVADGTTGGRQRVQCAGRKQGNGCGESSCYASRIEGQIGDALRSFSIPEHDRAPLIELWRKYSGNASNNSATRAKLSARLERLKSLYLDGDIDRTEYQDQRSAIVSQLADLPAGEDNGEEVAERLAAFLANVANAWELATADERNQIARQMFTEVVVLNRTAVAVLAKPQLRPFFLSLAVKNDGELGIGGSDGLPSRAYRVSKEHVLIALPAPTERYAETRKRVTESTRSLVRHRLDSGHSLREVAKEFGISHETVRAIGSAKPSHDAVTDRSAA